MAKLFITLAALSGMSAVVFGAFGAHALKSRLDVYSLGVFEKAVQYQFYHSLALLGVGVLALHFNTTLLKTSGWLFLTGMVFFSGSLYVLGLSGVRWWGAVTPIGGLALIAAWACLAVYAWTTVN